MGKITATLEFESLAEMFEILGGPEPKPSVVSNLGQELEEDATAKAQVSAVPTDPTPTEPTPPVTAPASPELDTEGLPWDERIHASTKGTKKDGTWKRRSRITDELFNQVRAELKGTPVTVETPQAPATVEKPQATPTPVAPVLDALATVVKPTPPVTATAEPEKPMDYFDLLQKFTGHGYAVDQMNAFLTANFNIASIALLQTQVDKNPNLIQNISNAIDQAVTGQ